MPPKKKTAAPRPVTAAERAEILRRHALGESRNDIARELKRSGQTISRIVAAEGLSFARGAEVAAATAAIQLDNKAKRTLIIQGLLDIALDDIDFLRREGGYQLVEVSMGEPVEYHVDRLPAQDRKALVTAISSGSAAAARLEAVDAGDGSNDARSMLGALAEGIRRWAGEDTAGEG